MTLKNPPAPLRLSDEIGESDLEPKELEAFRELGQAREGAALRAEVAALRQQVLLRDALIRKLKAERSDSDLEAKAEATELEAKTDGGS
jgi:hypothetical protein